MKTLIILLIVFILVSIGNAQSISRPQSDTVLISTTKLDSLIIFVNKEMQRFAEIEKEAQDTQKHLRGVLNAFLIIKNDTTVQIRKK